MKLAKLERTGLACPSQWRGETEGGREVYVRYRHGHLRVVLGDPKLTAPLYDNRVVVDKETGDSLDGYMETADMLRETSLEWDGDPEHMDNDIDTIFSHEWGE